MSLVEAFLSGAQRVTVEVTYYIPREAGQGPLAISPTLLGRPAREISHSGILQTFVIQKDDRSDLEDKKLRSVFEELVLSRGGIINVHDRRLRMVMMTDGNVDFNQAAVMPIIIPKPEEVKNAGMQEAVNVFKTMVPFPAVRRFLQYWQDNIDGPMHQVRLACGSIATSSLQQKHMIH